MIKIKIKKTGNWEEIPNMLNRVKNAIEHGDIVKGIADAICKKISDAEHKFSVYFDEKTNTAELIGENSFKTLKELKGKHVAIVFDDVPKAIAEGLVGIHWIIGFLPVFFGIKNCRLYYRDIRPDEYARLKEKMPVIMLRSGEVFSKEKVAVKFGDIRSIENMIVFEDVNFNTMRREYGLGMKYEPKINKVIDNIDVIFDEVLLKILK